MSYIAVAPWALMPLLAYFKVTQLTEFLFTIGGFLIITFLFFWNMIEESRKDLEIEHMVAVDRIRFIGGGIGGSIRAEIRWTLKPYLPTS